MRRLSGSKRGFALGAVALLTLAASAFTAAPAGARPPNGGFFR
jgi:hypothetical protein